MSTVYCDTSEPTLKELAWDLHDAVVSFKEQPSRGVSACSQTTSRETSLVFYPWQQLSPETGPVPCPV